MNVDIAELVAAMIHESGGSIVLNAESLETDFTGQMIAIDYEATSNRFTLTLVDTSDIDFGEEDA